LTPDDDKPHEIHQMAWLTSVMPGDPSSQLDLEYSWGDVLLLFCSNQDKSKCAVKPQEPFSIWWRHHVVYTRVWYPFRNDRLSLGERLILVAASACFTLLLCTRWYWGLENLRDKVANQQAITPMGSKLRAVLLSDAVPRVIFNAGLLHLALYGHVHRRFFRHSHFVVKRAIGMVLGEVMLLVLAAVLVNVSFNMWLLLDSRTCWQILALFEKFCEVEAIALVYSIFEALIKYQLLLVGGAAPWDCQEDDNWVDIDLESTSPKSTQRVTTPRADKVDIDIAPGSPKRQR